MTNEQIVTAFVGGASKGKSNSMYIEGRVLYSYGPHFLLAVRNSNEVIINTDKYSHTTSCQQSLVRNACAFKNTRLVDTDTIKKIVRGGVA